MIKERQSCLNTKGFIFDIMKYAIHDGPGIRTTVFFKGCPLQCRWCHNPESWKRYPEHGLRLTRCIGCGRCVEVCKAEAISLVDGQPVTDPDKCNLCGECVDACVAGAREIIGRQMTVSEVMAEIEKDVIFYDQSGGGVTFSGGEPLMQPEFLLALLDQCRAQQIHTAVDTSCYAEPQVVEMVSEKTDLFLCDIKHIDSDTHERFTGVGNSLILDNIRRLSKLGNQIVIRIPLVAGFNDDQTNIETTGKFIASLSGVGRIDVLPYNRGGIEKSARLNSNIELMQAEAPDEQQIGSIAHILGNCGLQVKIGG
jgi:pyruvate formate lyase activating enzyme